MRSTITPLVRKLSRRQFLVAAAAAGGALFAACAPEPQAPTQAPVASTTAPTSAAPTTAAQKPPATTAPTPAPRKPVTLVWMFHGGANAKDADLKMFYSMYPETKEWLKIEPLSVGKNGSDVSQALRLALAANQNIPDVAVGGVGLMPEFARAGEVYDIGEMLKPYLDDLTEPAKKLASYRGKYVAVPQNVKIKLWFYRKDLFEQAGIAVDSIKTFDDYMVAGAKFRAKHPNNYFMNLGPRPAYDWYPMLISAYDDGRFATEDGKYVVTSHRAFTDLFKQLKAMYKSGFAWPVEDFTEDWNQSFADEKIAGWLYLTGGVHWITRLAPKQLGKWDMTIWPEFSRKGGHGATAFIPKRAQHPQEAFEFLRLLLLDAKGNIERWKQKAGILPVTNSGRDGCRKIINELKTKPDWMKDEEWAVHPVNFYGPGFLEKMFKAEEYFQLMEIDAAHDSEVNILVEHLNSYMTDKVELEKALANAQADLEKQIGNPYK